MSVLVVPFIATLIIAALWQFADTPAGAMEHAPAPPRGNAANAPMSPSGAAAAPTIVDNPSPETSFRMETPIDYEDEQGNPRTATLGELIRANERLRRVPGDVDLDDMVIQNRAMAGDVEAQKKLLSTHLAKLTAAGQPAAQPELITALNDRIAKLEQQVLRSQRVVGSIEDQEFRAQVGNILSGNKQIRELCPWLCADPKIGTTIASAFLKNVYKAAEMSGRQVTSRDVMLQLQAANAHVQAIAGGFGGRLPVAQPAEAQQIVAANSGVTASRDGVVRPAQLSPADLLRPTAQAQTPAQTNILPGNVPSAGSATSGGTPTGTPQNAGNRPFSKDSLVQRLKQQRAVQGVEQ
jgi:hypothetical protein